jgi:hypothetical protein
MNTYAVKFKDPRWQRRRLEIMQKDSFACVACKASSEMLNVHHRYYVAGRDPWAYPDWALITLCDSCHKDEHDTGKHRDCPFEQWEISVGFLDDRTHSMEVLWNACTGSVEGGQK